MPGFQEDLTVTHLSTGGASMPDSWPAARKRRARKNMWRLARMAGTSLIFDLGGGVTIEVPVGFVTDGPSIPKIFWNILPVWGIWARAGVIHDFICCLLAMARPHEAARTRKDCDRIFLRAMVDLDVGWVQFSVLYLGVCIGRWFNVRTTMIDYNVKLSAVLDARIDVSSDAEIKAAIASPVGGPTPLPLIQDHRHTFAALNANYRAVVPDAVHVAKQQACR